MLFKKNYEDYPENLFEPDVITLGGNEYTRFIARFRSLTDLYEYLKSEPRINDVVFKELSSLNGDFYFAGIPYDKALESLIQDKSSGYKEFLRLTHELDTKKLIKTKKYQTVMSIAGGHINTHAYATGAPLCYEETERISEAKFVRMYISLSYRCMTTKEAVFNRALIVTNIMKALESAGYNIDLNTFELSYEKDEIIDITVKLKKQAESINLENIYKALCNVEFLRRIMFRVLETMDVTNDWQDGYGKVCPNDMIKKYFKIKKEDILIPEPFTLGVGGIDLIEDFERAMENLNLTKVVDMDKSRLELKKDILALKRKKN